MLLGQEFTDNKNNSTIFAGSIDKPQAIALIDIKRVLNVQPFFMCDNGDHDFTKVKYKPVITGSKLRCMACGSSSHGHKVGFKKGNTYAVGTDVFGSIRMNFTGFDKAEILSPKTMVLLLQDMGYTVRAFIKPYSNEQGFRFHGIEVLRPALKGEDGKHRNIIDKTESKYEGTHDALLNQLLMITGMSETPKSFKSKWPNSIDQLDVLKDRVRILGNY